METALPDEIVLDILTRVYHSSHRVSRNFLAPLWVCRQWRRVALDREIWRNSTAVLGLREALILARLGVGQDESGPLLTVKFQPSDVSLPVGYYTRLLDLDRQCVAQAVKTASFEGNGAIVLMLVGVLWRAEQATILETMVHPAMFDRLSHLRELTLSDVGFVETMRALLASLPAVEKLSFDLGTLPSVELRHTFTCEAVAHARLRELRFGRNTVAFSGNMSGCFTAANFPCLEVLIFENHTVGFQDGDLFGLTPPPNLHTLVGPAPPLSLDVPRLRTLGHMSGSAPTTAFMGRHAALDKAPNLVEYIVPFVDVSMHRLSDYANALKRFPAHVTVRCVDPHARFPSQTIYSNYAIPVDVGECIVYKLEGSIEATGAGGCEVVIRRARALEGDREPRCVYEVHRIAVT